MTREHSTYRVLCFHQVRLGSSKTDPGPEGRGQLSIDSCKLNIGRNSFTMTTGPPEAMEEIYLLLGLGIP
jgi:hypothetical protein